MIQHKIKFSGNMYRQSFRHRVKNEPELSGKCSSKRVELKPGLEVWGELREAQMIPGKENNMNKGTENSYSLTIFVLCFMKHITFMILFIPYSSL